MERAVIIRDSEQCGDYISREAALACFRDWVDRHGDVHTADEMPEYRAIEALPTVDAAPIRHGRWIRQGDRSKPLYGWNICSECGAVLGSVAPYCSECGATLNDGAEMVGCSTQNG